MPVRGTAGELVPQGWLSSYSLPGGHLRGGSAPPRLAQTTHDALLQPAPGGCWSVLHHFFTLIY